MRKTYIFVAIATLAAVVIPAGRAAAAHGCGDTVGRSIRLDNSLSNCKEDGLVIGEDGITIDLGGNTIDGTGDGSGILNDEGFKDVVIRNGTITGFSNGVLIESSRDTGNTIEDIELSKNEIAIFVDGAGKNEIKDNELAGNEEGIAIVGEENLVDGNEIFDEEPAVAVEGDGNEILDNEIDYAVAGNTAPAIVFEGDDNLIEDNDVLAGENGIEGEGNDNIIANNDLEGGAGHAILLEGWKNEVRDNKIKAYDDVGIYLTDGKKNLITDNKVKDVGDEGILAKADATRIEGNKTDDNGNDGISVDADDATVSDNDADDNGSDNKGYGIVVDGEGVEGSGNDARGNANTKECDPATLCE